MFFVVLALTAGLVGFAVDFNAKAAAALVGLAWSGIVALFFLASQFIAGSETVEKLVIDLDVANKERRTDLAAVAEILKLVIAETATDKPLGVGREVMDRFEALLPKEEGKSGGGLATELERILALRKNGGLTEDEFVAAKAQAIRGPATATKPASTTATKIGTPPSNIP
jgi:hypothetical protein